MNEALNVHGASPPRLWPIAGKALREWRVGKGWSLDRLRAELAARTSEPRRPSRGYLSEMESGRKAPGEVYLRALEALGAPVGPWRERLRAMTPPPAAMLDSDPRALAAAAEVEAAMRAGQPPAAVYALAAAKLSTLLRAGLTEEQGRAWGSLMILLKDWMTSGASTRKSVPS